MTLPKPYQEFLVRWYYYDHTDETTIPDTVPVEHIEDHIVYRMTSANMWVSKGFASARNVNSNDNLDFKNDAEFNMFCHYVAKLYFRYGVNNKWFKEDISKKEFLEYCHAFNSTHPIHI
jgi:hypothetical protein